MVSIHFRNFKLILRQNVVNKRSPNDGIVGRFLCEYKMIRHLSVIQNPAGKLHSQNQKG